MNLYELSEDENNPIYQQLTASNYIRKYSFLSSIISTAISSDKTWLSESFIKAINFHAIVGLHHQPGQYRSHQVAVGSHTPPQPYRVPLLMEDLVNFINRNWESMPPPTLAAMAFWRINWIHPFENGNGRTARDVCYYVLCVRFGQLLRGHPILPEIMRTEPRRTEYIEALRRADQGDMSHLPPMITQDVMKQITSIHSQLSP